MPLSRFRRNSLVAVLTFGFAGVCLCVFLRFHRLPGVAQADLGQQFLAWRAFAAEALRHGRLPLWNPYVYSGEPFLGGFQSAVFYPPNLLFLVLPLVAAVNATLVLHGAVLGLGVYRWCTQRGADPAGAFLAAVLVVGSGSVFPHVYAGHLSNLCTLAWTPWVLLYLDRWNAEPCRRSLLLASLCLALAVLAGQLQYVYLTLCAALVQSAASGRLRPFAGLAAAGAVATALAAAQILPGASATAESLRQAPLTSAFAAQFSLPPENLLTLLAPGFFGGVTASPYWGRCYCWETTIYLGPVALIVASLSAARRSRMCLAIGGLFLLLSLGAHTPIFTLLYRFAPGFSHFRGWSKFAFPATLFLALAVADGVTVLLRGPEAASSSPRLAVGLSVALGVVLLIAAVYLHFCPAAMGSWIAASRRSGESYLPAAVLADPVSQAGAAGHAAASLAMGAALLLLVGALLALSWFTRRGMAASAWVATFILALAAGETASFAWTQWATFDPAEAFRPDLQPYVAARPGDYRVQNLLDPNNGFFIGAPDVWGNDPALPKRYAQFMAYGQGMMPDSANQGLTFRRLSPLYRMVRLRFVFTHTDEGVHAYEIPGSMPHALLVPSWRVLSERDATLAALAAPEFNPWQTVILETAPALTPSAAPGPGATAGHVRLFNESADSFDLEADTPSPAVLLITDDYSKDWKATPMPGSSQPAYAVVPADYTLRATPLSPGHHRIHFEYRPRGLVTGLWISAIALFAWTAALATAAPRRSPRPVP